MMMPKLKKALAAVLAAALVVPGAPVAAHAAAAANPPAEFQGLEVSDDLVTIKISTGVQYNSFLTQSPPRLVMELLDTKHEGPARSVKGQGKYLASARSGQFERAPRLITRVVLDLVKMAGYKVGLVDGGLTVQLVGSVEDDEPKTQAPAPAAPPAPRPKAKPKPAVASAPAPVPAPAVVPVPVPVPASAPQAAAAPEPAPAPQAAAAPAAAPAPAPAAEPEPAEKPKPRVRNNTAAAAFKRAGLQGKMLPELAAAAENEDISKAKIEIPEDLDDEKSDRRLGGRIYRDVLARLPSDPISLEFDNTDIRDVLKLLGAKAKLNIIYGDDVQGTLTLRLSEVPFNEAFRTILSMMKLTSDQVGTNVMRVITPSELAKQRTVSSAITKVIPLNYAKAMEVQSTVNAVRQAEGRAGATSVDVKTNSLIVTESLEGLQATENLIAQLDQRPRQVLIEAKLVEVNANSGFQYGIQWDYYQDENGKSFGKQGTTLIGSSIGLPDPFTTPLDRNSLKVPGVGATGGTGAAGRGTGVALSADRVFGALTVGRITNNFLLNATITAAASEGKAKVLSDPKIATLNNQPANIAVNTQIPYVTSNVASTGVQTQTVSYATTGITLVVTPSISGDGRIMLDIAPTVSQPSVSAAGSSATGAPAIDSRTAKTTVMARDGETIVIGGLINDTMQDTIAKIPLLGDIPILGWLFKKKSKTRVRNELLIFVTARIMPD